MIQCKEIKMITIILHLSTFLNKTNQLYLLLKIIQMQ